MPVLLPNIYKHLGESVSIMKSGNTYRLISFDSIRIKDILNFTAPCSLSKYLKQWNGTDTKGIFPYQYFKSVEQVNATTEFPPYEAFHSSLKGDVAIEEYESAKRLFNHRRSLPSKHPNHWSSMKDYLQFYNQLDTKPLVEAIVNSFEAFAYHFDVAPNRSFSLPSMAFKSMFNQYDRSLPLSYSFRPKDDEIRQLFRNSSIGGLTTVTHRHINLMDSNSPLNSRFAPDGNRFTSVSFWDFNRFAHTA